MPHISLPPAVPGIRALLGAFPQTGAALSALAETLLRGPSPLTPAERELIAAHVSHGNACTFCTNSHAATARVLHGGGAALVDDVLRDGRSAAGSAKLQALLAIADKVRADGRTVTTADIEAAKAAGADDRMIHDTVLIAAAFCMYNRYVDGLATEAPTDPRAYAAMGEHLAKHGYVRG